MPYFLLYIDSLDAGSSGYIRCKTALTGYFPTKLKWVDVNPVFWKESPLKKVTNLWICYKLFRKFLKGLYINKWAYMLIMFCHHICVVRERGLAHKNYFYLERLRLRKSRSKIRTWFNASHWLGFENNYMKLSNNNSHLLLSSFMHEVIWISIFQSEIYESKREKLLGIIIDGNMKFNDYIQK